MADDHELRRKAEKTLTRILPRLEVRFAAGRAQQPEQWDTLLRRLETYFPDLFSRYYRLYARHYDFFYYLEELLAALAESWLARPAALKELDSAREQDPLWFQSNQMLGGVCYVDLFAGNLLGLREKIPYFKELGLTYLHLMPLFLAPEGENDGGYAIRSYRQVNPALGTMEELAALAAKLRAEGISLVLDFVFNHTSDDHLWAQKALAGDPEYQEYYRMFPNRALPDAYERHLREIFPEEHPGAFTYRPEIQKWVWTTFHTYQWDLNYDNPQVFNRMTEEMLYLANQGVEVLRLDAVAFLWKELGTACENLPEAHVLIQTFNAAARIAAPALLFKSEAIVHPDEVVKYIAPEECQLSYNPLLMALLWNSLATRKVDMLNLALQERFNINPQCAWVNYVRCHDDIGWTFSDDDAARLGINGFDHRQFLNAFFIGRFPGSFARGLPFQENPKTGDARISGMCASLAGLEKALKEETEAEVELAIKRILLLHGVILTIGGLPLIYLGDEIGALNDYGFRDDPRIAGDTRWVHRLRTDWEQMARRQQVDTLESRVYQGLQRLIRLRKTNAVFSGSEMEVVETGSPHVLGYLRRKGTTRLLALANFSEQPQEIPENVLRLSLLGYEYYNYQTGELLAGDPLIMEAYDFLCLASRG